MSDLISRKALREELKKRSLQLFEYYVENRKEKQFERWDECEVIRGIVEDAPTADGNVQAIPTLERCLQKYKDTGNTEYLLDLANYAMFEFMWPQHPKGHFRATDSSESAGIVGMSVGEMERFREGGGN